MAMKERRGPYICGIDAGMDVVTGKWKSLILWELDAHPVRRFGELRRGLPGVSEKVLIQQLREMEADGLVHREVFHEVPPRVEYSITPLGATLADAVDPLRDWAEKNLKEVLNAQRRYDAARKDMAA